MKITYDPPKSRDTKKLRGFDFDIVYGFDWASARYTVDSRKDYGEVRELAVGFIGEIVFTVCFTRRGDDLHVISVRRASRKERRIYAQA